MSRGVLVMDFFDSFYVEKFGAIRECFSPERLKAYEMLVFPANKDLSIPIYQLVQMLSSHFFLPLQYLELCLRNKTYNTLVDFYRKRKTSIGLPGSPENWLAWMPQNPEIQKQVKNAQTKAARDIKGRTILPGDIISRLSFGTWIGILEEYPDNKHDFFFWNYAAPVIFPEAPSRKKAQLIPCLNKINTIRNRLFHHEPLWKTSKAMANSYPINETIEDIEKSYLLILDVLNWISPSLYSYFLSSLQKASFDSVAGRLRDMALMYKLFGERSR
jgi:hypothetical protein